MPVSIAHAKSLSHADLTGTITVNNSSGGTQTAMATDLMRPGDWNSAHAATLQITPAEIGSLFAAGGELYLTTNTNGITFGESALMMNGFEPFPLPNTNSTNSVPGIGTWYFDPFYLPSDLASGVIRFYYSQGVSSALMQNGAVFTTSVTGSVTRVQTIYNRFAIYKQGSGNSSTALYTVWTGDANLYATQAMAVATSTNSSITVSNYLTVSFPGQFDASGGQTYSSTATSTTVGSSTTTTIAASIGSSVLAGARNFVTGAQCVKMGMNVSLPAGQYWLAHMQTSTSSTTGTGYGAGTLFSTGSLLGLLENNLAVYRPQTTTASSTNTHPIPFHGYLATVSSAASSAVASTDIIGTTGRMYWNHLAISQ